MKKTVLVYNVQNVNIKTTRGQKAVISELRRKKTLTEQERQEVNKLYKQQKKLTKYKRLVREASSKEERSKYSKKVKSYSKTVERSFNKTLGIKKTVGRKTDKYDGLKVPYRQSIAGRKFIRINKYGLAEVTTGKRMTLQHYATYRQREGMISTFDEFEVLYDTKRDIKETLQQYNVTAYFSNFVGGTSSAWTRRVMNAVGISDTVSEDKFYDWLVKKGHGGTSGI